MGPQCFEAGSKSCVANWQILEVEPEFWWWTKPNRPRNDLEERFRAFFAQVGNWNVNERARRRTAPIRITLITIGFSIPFSGSAVIIRYWARVNGIPQPYSWGNPSWQQGSALAGANAFQSSTSLQFSVVHNRNLQALSACLPASLLLGIEAVCYFAPASADPWYLRQDFL